MGFLLLSLVISAGLTDLSNKWTHVVLGFMALPIAWSLHFIVKRKWTWKSPEVWALLLAFFTLIGVALAGNPYNALLGWIVLNIGLLVLFATRTLTPEHRSVLLIGTLIIGVLWMGWSFLALHTSVAIPWLPTLSKDPVALGGFALLPLATGATLLKRQSLWKNVLIGIGCGIIVLPIVLPSFSQRLHQDWKTTAQLAPALEKVFTSHPWFGIGTDNIQYVYPRFATSHSVFAAQAPSSALDMLTSYGGVALLAFIGLIVACVYVRPFRVTRERGIFGVAVVLTVTLAFVANTWQHPALWLGFWIFIGLLAPPVATSEVSDQTTRKGLRRIIISVSTLFAVQAIVMGLGLNHFASAERAALSGDTKNAAKLYAQSLRFDPDPEQRRSYAESLWLNTYQNKDLAEAEHQARLAYQWNRNDAFARQVAARVAFSESKYAEAERLYKESLERDPVFSLDVYISLADVYKKQGKTSEEIAILKQGLAKYPESPELPDVMNSGYLQQLQTMRERVTTLSKQK